MISRYVVYLKNPRYFCSIYDTCWHFTKGNSLRTHVISKILTVVWNTFGLTHLSQGKTLKMCKCLSIAAYNLEMMDLGLRILTIKVESFVTVKNGINGRFIVHAKTGRTRKFQTYAYKCPYKRLTE